MKTIRSIQLRLKKLGYYKGKATGSCGAMTRKAVHRFQKDYRLKPTGSIDANTCRRIVQLTIRNPELEQLARVIHGEARGEPFRGQVAVGAVVLNRLKSPLFPNTLSGVITEPFAFTALADGQFWLKPNESAYRAAKVALTGKDPTGTCLYYFNPRTATLKWIWTRRRVLRIGRHIFAKD